MYDNALKALAQFNTYSLINFYQYKQRFNYNVAKLIGIFTAYSSSQLFTRLDGQKLSYLSKVINKFTLKSTFKLFQNFYYYLTINLVLLNKFLTNTVTFVPVYL